MASTSCLLGAAACLSCTCIASAQQTSSEKAQAPVATLSTGRIVGETLPDGVEHFSGVPYAAPPIGARRWLRPAPVEAWRGELDCSSRRPVSERRSRPVQPLGDDGGDRPPSEDCLHLDIWLPPGTLVEGQADDAATKNKSPVLVWIYGGGLLGGAKDDNGSSGQPYAERGIIYVAINYRVGALGFLRPHGGDANCGLWDQVTALQWVQSEIASLGGDPKQVTIMGQSAGADSVYWLCASPLANRLFSRAIIMSPASFTTTEDQARDLAEEFAANAGAKSAELEAMQELAVEDIMQAQQKARFRCHPTTGPGWRELMAGGSFPSVDPEPDPTESGIFRFPAGHAPEGWPMPVAIVDGELLKEPPLAALANGVASHLNIIVGGNKQENGFKAHSPEEPARGHSSCYGRWVPAGEALDSLVTRFAWELAGSPALLRTPFKDVKQIVAEELLPAYEIELEATGKGVKGLSSQELQDAIATDFSFLAKAHLVAERLSQTKGTGSVHRYQFQGFGDEGDAFHGIELEMLMGVEGDGVTRRAVPEVRGKWLDSWAAFVRTGDPNTQEMKGSWVQYNSSEPRVMLWDGVHGWSVDDNFLVPRKGLLATAQLWERLWGFEAGSSCSIS